MVFAAAQPTGFAANITKQWYVYASGVIDGSTADRLKALVTSKKIAAGAFLFLDSPGGSLLGGIDLGREVRAAGFYTYVAAANGVSDVGTPDSRPALCASACTLAFLGGRFRFIDEKSVYAVHRFYFTESTSDAADLAQILSSAIVQFMRDMGVDPKLFTLSTSAGKSKVVIPTRQQLIDFNVVNNGEEKPVWSIEAVPQGLYLRGEHNTVWGDNKLALMCEKKGQVAVSAFFPTRGRESLLQGEKAAGLLLDGKVMKIPPNRVVGPLSKNGVAMVTMALDASET